MKLGNIEYFKGTGYVCFLDILGFSQDILANWNAEECNPLKKLLEIKAALSVDNAEDNDMPEESSVRRYVCRVNTVSDSITIAFGLEPKLIIGDMALGLEALVANIREVWRAAIERAGAPAGTRAQPRRHDVGLGGSQGVPARRNRQRQAEPDGERERPRLWRARRER